MDGDKSEEATEEKNRTWQTFTEETTMHGIRHTTIKSKSILSRVLWSIIILVSFSYFCGAANIFLTQYINKTIITKIKLKNAANLTFPTVTVCNRNYWKTSAIARDFTYEGDCLINEWLWYMYSDKALSPPPPGTFNWSHPYWLAMGASYPLNEDAVAAYMGAMSHQPNETIIDCIIKGSVVKNCTKMWTNPKTDAGFCYQFNQDGDLQTNSAGVSGGIYLVLDAQVDEYDTGPYSAAEGFSIAVHDKDDHPAVSELSYGASVGMETTLMLQKVTTDRVPPIADNFEADCLDTEKLPNPLHSHAKYSYSACVSECRTSYVLNECGCRHILNPPLNESYSCSIIRQLECATPAMSRFTEDQSLLDACDCRANCKETSYSASVYSVKFPNKNYMRRENYTADHIDYMSKNYVAVRIYYGQMSYQSVEEKKAYDAFDLVANVGGTLGVSLGASLLTLVEFIEFVVIFLTNFIHKNFNGSKNKVTVIKAAEPLSLYK